MIINIDFLARYSSDQLERLYNSRIIRVSFPTCLIIGEKIQTLRQRKLDIGSEKINYYESQGVGSTAILVHGNSLSSLTFKNQLESPLGQQFRLIALDLPGHGLSDFATDAGSSYTLAGFAEVIIQVTETLRLSDVVFIGCSLGGHILMEAAGRLDKAMGLAIFGAPPIGNPTHVNEAFLPNPAFPDFFKAELTDDDVMAMCANCFKPDIPEIPGIFQRAIRETDKDVRAVLGESLAKGDFKDEVKAIAGLSCPIAVLHGEHDQFVNSSYFNGLHIPTLWRGSVQIISDAGHSPQWERPKEFNHLIREFIEYVSNPDNPGMIQE